MKKRKPDGLIVEFERKNGEGKTNKFTMDCAEKGAPELYAAMDALAEDVTDLCELPEVDGTSITVKGVSYSYGGDTAIMGAVIIAQRTLKSANSPMNVLTPHKSSEPYNEGGHADPKALFDDQTTHRLDVLLGHVAEYVDGKREAVDLFEGKGDGEPATSD